MIQRIHDTTLHIKNLTRIGGRKQRQMTLSLSI